MIDVFMIVSNYCDTVMGLLNNYLQLYSRPQESDINSPLWSVSCKFIEWIDPEEKEKESSHNSVQRRQQRKR